ncbi:MAG: hypothetical protein ACRD2A_12365 [Vicinamibacterales bacterium]
MPTKTIVMVLDPDDHRRGEITVLDEAREAERMVETILERGTPRERIRIFDSTEIEMQVTHRPVVSFGSGSTSQPSTSEPCDSHGGAQASDEATPGEDAQDEFAPAVDSPADEPVSEPAAVSNGVRFSSLFKSDDVSREVE